MQRIQNIPKSIAALLIFGRPPLVFMGMVWAIAVFITRNPIYYIMGVGCLFTAMIIDLVDEWFASRFDTNYKLTHLAERIMNKIVFSIIFPVVSVGMMWKFHFVSPTNSKPELLHVVFVLLLCVTVLTRENFAHFMRNFALRKGEEEELSEITRLRTLVASPVALILYTHAFYIPEGPASSIYFWISWMGNIPLRLLFFIEIIFFIINVGSIAGYCKRYGSYCLDELCMDDEQLRLKILSIFPNFLTFMNAMMGVLSVFFAYHERMREAYMIMIGAAIFDRLDGAIARKLGISEMISGDSNANNKHISFGSILDDIADAVSFCIAPALIFYILFSRCPPEILENIPYYGWVALFYTLMGFVRLAYFTLDKNPIPGFFKGLPTPAAALFISAPMIMFQHSLENNFDHAAFWALFCFIQTIVVSFLMNFYPIHYLHAGRFAGRHPFFSKFMFCLNGISVFTPFFGHFNFLLCFIYVLSPIFTWKLKPEIAVQETIIR